MSTRNISFVPGEFYHVYNRGVDKRTLFQDTKDYERFTQLLFLSNSSRSVNIRELTRSGVTVYEYERENQQIAIGAYCLMPNHFHILVTPLSDLGLTNFMSRLGTSYAMYFNTKYERTGALFEGKFKAEFVDSDRYLKYLYSYIHLNPVKLIDSTWKELGVKDTLVSYEYAKNYSYSSLSDYLGVTRPQSALLNPTLFPQYFNSPQEAGEEIMEWLAYKDSV